MQCVHAHGALFTIPSHLLFCGPDHLQVGSQAAGGEQGRNHTEHFGMVASSQFSLSHTHVFYLKLKCMKGAGERLGTRLLVQYKWMC